MCEILTEKSICIRVKDDQECATHYQNLAYNALCVLSDHDLKLFLEIRWTLCTAVRCVNLDFAWERIVMDALTAHYSLSKIELSSDCVCVAQWLLQMSSKQSLQSLISLCIYSLKPNLGNSCNNTSNLHADLRSLQAHNKVYIGYYP